ncbi:MAG TPA: SEC-C metal-binding domain-containing protein [Polyangiaceae bacterium]|nr:SEC-C metal-binding domain-containing protein [Polyangiaceae bacterium]
MRRVVDFDGRSTLHDVHNAIQRVMNLDDDHLYAFYLSGRYFDRSSEYSTGPDSRYDSSRSVLFRLGLNAGQQFAYLFDFGDELRHTVTVDAISDVDVALQAPMLVESVGEAPSQYPDFEEGETEPYSLPESLSKFVPLTDSLLTLNERLDALYEEEEEQNEDEDEDEDEDEPAAPSEAIVSLFRELAKAALELAAELNENQEALHELDKWSQRRALLSNLIELPRELTSVGELDYALAVARAFAFADAEWFSGDIAIIFAESGKREEAMTQLEANVKQFPASYLTARKTGEALESLDQPVAAETAYRKAMKLAEHWSERESARNLLIGLLEDMGRFEEIDALDALDSPSADGAAHLAPKPLAAVGRNDPCPCGSGKKCQKCHGA